MQQTERQHIAEEARDRAGPMSPSASERAVTDACRYQNGHPECRGMPTTKMRLTLENRRPCSTSTDQRHLDE
jgi:hypothetical protein